MRLIATILTLSAALGVCSCASRAASIAPVSISSSDYAALSCDDTRGELTVAREKQNALTRQQNNAATADAAGVFLLLLPLGSVFGADVEGELAQAKGEVLALERALSSNC